MKNVLVTGGTGFIGSNLALALLKEGCHVRILRRANSDLRAIGTADVEHCIGDVRDIESIRRALKGCDTIFHTAALISYWRKERPAMMDVNVAGTCNMVTACIEAGVEKFVHTSSVAAIGFRTDGKPADEDNIFNWDAYDVGYRISKHLAEREVLRGIKLGLPAVIVNPSVVIGPRDIHVHGGQIIRDVARKRVFYYTQGTINVAYADDIVRGHLQAARQGRVGERYILGGENLTLREVFYTTATLTGGIKPLFNLPTAAAQTLAATVETIGNVLNIKPWVTRELLAGIGLQTFFTSEKAQRDLGYSMTPFREAVRKTHAWYRENGFL